ncbi:MAG TPA: RcnB family protein [Burkholderiaceae bacterium]|nr:RcnB family protein [Burkholderiaceae bacterium]
MTNRSRTLVSALSVMAALAAGTAMAEDRDHGHPPVERRGEPHPGPGGYERPAEPHGWDARPREFDRGAYQHNFQAPRVYRIGPYHRPPGWAAHRWVYGQVLPRAFWAAPYIIADYWLFGLEIPPMGYEWVRDDGDALLINTANGQILQVEYGVFG